MTSAADQTRAEIKMKKQFLPLIVIRIIWNRWQESLLALGFVLTVLFVCFSIVLLAATTGADFPPESVLPARILGVVGLSPLLVGFSLFLKKELSTIIRLAKEEIDV